MNKKDGDFMKHRLIFLTILFLIILNFFYINNVYAVEETIECGPQIAARTSINPDDYKPDDEAIDQNVLSIGNKVIGIVQAVGSIASVIVLICIGIKYMMGSVEEKAEYKNTLIYYVIGAVLVFAISNITAIIYNFAITLGN